MSESFTLYWRDGVYETIKGNSFIDAIEKSNHSVRSLFLDENFNFWQKGEREYKWENEKWVRDDNKHTFIVFIDGDYIGCEAEGKVLKIEGDQDKAKWLAIKQTYYENVNEKEIEEEQYLDDFKEQLSFKEKVVLAKQQITLGDGEPSKHLFEMIRGKLHLII